MTLYVDTSVPVAIAFEEPGHERFRQALAEGGELLSSNLLEAEFRAALRREGVAEDRSQLLSWFRWVLPSRPLSPEFNRILSVAYLRGADLWHLACALALQERVGRLRFLSADHRQLQVATKLGLPIQDARQGP